MRHILRLICFTIIVLFCVSWTQKHYQHRGECKKSTGLLQTIAENSTPDGWTELTSRDEMIIDIRYATANNFVHEPVYPCGRCFLKTEVADALKKVNQQLLSKKYKLMLFDCYRPRPVQQKLWDKVPNPDYVADPAKGSMHNRGTAIDLTLADLSGKEINMGTAYDFFGPEAHQDCTALPKEVLARRHVLKSAMEAAGFKAIRTEWWHFSFKELFPPLSDWQWPCD